MPLLPKLLITGQIYHIINRGLDKRPIFNNFRDYQRFIETMAFYQRDEKLPRFSEVSPKELREIIQRPLKKKLVEIICYCLMPNHFHLLLKQTVDGGISKYLRIISDSYTRYFNVKNKRKGTICEGRFRSVLIEDDNQLLQVSRYIHLNPVTSYLVKEPENYRWSSYLIYTEPVSQSFIKCQTNLILEHFSSRKEYQNFVLDYKEYAQQLEKIKHLVLE